MKNFRFFFWIPFLFQPPASEFAGVLHYESDYDVAGSAGKVLTTFYETGSNVRVESENIQTKAVFGKPTTEDQDVIIYDFDKQTEMHLQTLTNHAIVTPFDATLTQQQQLMDKMGSEITVQNLGSEKVGSYNCTHYVMTTINTKMKILNNTNKKEIWVTKDLGSCHLWYAGSYLYYPEGTFFWKKFADAGADGLVVKWQTSNGTLSTSCTLTSYEIKELRSSFFTPPSGFTIVKPDMSQLPVRN